MNAASPTPTVCYVTLWCKTPHRGMQFSTVSTIVRVSALGCVITMGTGISLSIQSLLIARCQLAWIETASIPDTPLWPSLSLPFKGEPDVARYHWSTVTGHSLCNALKRHCLGPEQIPTGLLAVVCYFFPVLSLTGALNRFRGPEPLSRLLFAHCH